jgi:lysylphosphatidylglycerol synthetase-like protein (DUF2156 family)
MIMVCPGRRGLAGGMRVEEMAVWLKVMRGSPMAVVLVALLIILILGGLGFAIHVLWWLALVALVIWLLGFVVRVGETVGRPRRRFWYKRAPRRHWYYW